MVCKERLIGKEKNKEFGGARTVLDWLESNEQYLT